MKKLFFVTLLIQFNFIQSDYSVHPRADFVVNELVNSYGFDEKEVLEVLKNAKKQQTIIDRISTPAEFTITWDAYRNIFIEEKRIKNGKKFIEDNLPALKKAEEEFGVPKEIKDEPPWLISGKGIPTTGKSPITMPIFMNSVDIKTRVNPPITSLQNLSLAFIDK